MTPIERTSDGTVIFLNCGCAAWRILPHPTGAAVAVRIIQGCKAHATDPAGFRSIPKGELVYPFTRTPVSLDPIRAR
jgi:hypothetical protein